MLNKEALASGRFGVRSLRTTAAARAHPPGSALSASSRAGVVDVENARDRVEHPGGIRVVTIGNPPAASANPVTMPLGSTTGRGGGEGRSARADRHGHVPALCNPSPRAAAALSPAPGGERSTLGRAPARPGSSTRGG